MERGIVNGYVCDVARLQRTQLGVMALGTTPKNGLVGGGQQSIVIALGSTQFQNGWWVYADADGILLSQLDISGGSFGTSSGVGGSSMLTGGGFGGSSSMTSGGDGMGGFGGASSSTMGFGGSSSMITGTGGLGGFGGASSSTMGFNGGGSSMTGTGGLTGGYGSGSRVTGGYSAGSSYGGGGGMASRYGTGGCHHMVVLMAAMDQLHQIRRSIRRYSKCCWQRRLRQLFGSSVFHDWIRCSPICSINFNCCYRIVLV